MTVSLGEKVYLKSNLSTFPDGRDYFLDILWVMKVLDNGRIKIGNAVSSREVAYNEILSTDQLIEFKAAREAIQKRVAAAFYTGEHRRIIGEKVLKDLLEGLEIEIEE